ncbi:MAG: helix-turn-helix domain-containing protein [Tissierellia bacterium]|nr:helix-turn-helix domain-containing protein [Tissierellia bacterium]MDD4780813.1 helix-turn-helix domain-containing protein [Tissierellia bacterium]
MEINNSLFELALDKLGCISIVDKDGKYEYVNENWSNTFNIHKGEAIGQYASYFFQDTNIEEVLMTGKSLICDYESNENDIIYTAYIPLGKEDIVCGVLIYNEIKGLVNIFGFRKWLLNNEDNISIKNNNKQILYKNENSYKKFNKLILLEDMKLKEKQDILIKETLENALKRSNGNKAHAARILGISRTVIYDKLKKYNLI